MPTRSLKRSSLTKKKIAPQVAKPAAWVISGPLGKGTDLIAQACAPFASDESIIRADQYKSIPRRDRALWTHLQERPSLVSSLGSIPLIGQTLQKYAQRFSDQLPSRYPERQHIALNRRLVEFYYYLQNKGLGRDLIQRLSTEPGIPLVTGSPVVAFAAEVHQYPGPIFLICHTADPSRVWAPLEPRHTRIQWIVPTQMAEDRLKSYGIPVTHIHHAGFPLAGSAISSKGLHADVNARLARLDPEHVFKKDTKGPANSRPLSLGVIADNGWRTHELIKLINGAQKAIRSGELILHLFTGTDVARTDSIEAITRNHQLHRHLGSSIRLHAHTDERVAFESFTNLLPEIDVLWSAPSPWIFYAGLGIPFIVEPPIGTQEEARHAWVRGIQAGLAPLEKETLSEWLLDWKRSGGLARLGWNGYGSAPSMGLSRLSDLIQGKITEEEPAHATIPE